jgi:hypothetical protein
MTTMRDLIADTRRMAYGTLHEQINLVAENADIGATAIKMQLDVSNISPGMILSADLNVWYVRSVDTGSNTVYVIPGFDNSPQKEVVVGDFVFIKPRVTDWYLFYTMNQEILRLSSPSNGLYQLKKFTQQVDPTWQTYDLSSEDFSNFIGWARIRYRMPGTPDVWMDIPSKSYRWQNEGSSARVRLLRNIPSGTQVEFIYKATFSEATDLTDDVVAVCGLAPEMTDIPTLGALSTLLRTTDARRMQVQTQGDARRANEVQGGANSQFASQIDRDHKDRIQEEYARLVSRTPIIRSI